MPKKIVGINENFSKRDQEMVSEIIWDAQLESMMTFKTLLV